MRILASFSFLISIFLINACAVYEVDSASTDTLSGSLSKLIKKDRGRRIADQQKYDEAPIYVDYSKSNPLLRHDDEFDEDQEFESDDPFEEQVNFSDYQRMKKKQQARRVMEQEHKVTDEEKGPVSLW